MVLLNLPENTLVQLADKSVWLIDKIYFREKHVFQALKAMIDSLFEEFHLYCLDYFSFNRILVVLPLLNYSLNR